MLAALSQGISGAFSLCKHHQQNLVSLWWCLPQGLSPGRLSTALTSGVALCKGRLLAKPAFLRRVSGRCLRVWVLQITCF